MRLACFTSFVVVFASYRPFRETRSRFQRRRPISATRYLPYPVRSHFPPLRRRSDSEWLSIKLHPPSAAFSGAPCMFVYFKAPSPRHSRLMYPIRPRYREPIASVPYIHMSSSYVVTA
ncbi:hypothetical protein TNIN_17291 [Trichonephila inaurata madagascariensis]|uniref:Uncharacterized protein n=1 Tax=Trichonephila inaurata madagascariensis TaxID=2747483 RepID=A0A8X6XKX9_9ARAC|nr:hypothetical protein TNIN_17291 [Trichonephila inaurata madagascariensis]